MENRRLFEFRKADPCDQDDDHIAQYLQKVAQRLDEESSSDNQSGSKVSASGGRVGHMTAIPQRFELRRKIITFNNRIKLEAFRINFVNRDPRSGDLEYEGPLRFYLDDEEGENRMKAFRLTGSTSVLSLLPEFQDKFSLQLCIACSIKVYISDNRGERCLEQNERPLHLALTARTTPHFVVRVEGSCRDPNRRSRENRGGRDHTRPEVVQNDINRRRESKSVDRAFSRAYRFSDYGPSGPRQERGRSPTKKPVIIMPSRDDISENSITSNLGTVNGRIENNMGSNDMDLSKREKNVVVRSTSKTSFHRKKKSRSRDSSLDRDGSITPTGSGRMVSSLFGKSTSARRKNVPVTSRTELSTEDSAPGVLKIFGDSISPGAQYKSVLAVPTSTAQELVKEALERYCIPRKQASRYLLCDVIGTFVAHSIDKDGTSPEKGKWTEECIRIIGDNERPLILQSYWKPAEGYSRRFELRRRSDLLAMEDIDTTTSGVNANARRMLLTKSRGELTPDCDWGTLQKSSSCYFDDPTSGLDLIKTMNQANVSKSQDELCSPGKGTDSSVIDLFGEATTKDKSIDNVRIPQTHPYFIILLGCDKNTDKLVYILREPLIMIGGTKQGLNQNDIYLNSPDLSSPHCWLHMSDDPGSGQGQGPESTKHVSVDPLQGCIVAVNNVRIEVQTTLRTGDVVSIGSNYVFLFKNPETDNAFSKENSSRLSEVVNSKGNSLKIDVSGSGKEYPSSTEPHDVVQWRLRKNSDYESDQTRLKVSFQLGKEIELVDLITHIIDKFPNGYKLSPAYLILMTLEYSAVKHEQTHTRTLLLKIATQIQNIVWEKTKDLADKQSLMASHTQSVISELLPALRPVVLWMSNGLELLYHLQNNLSEYVMDPLVSLPPEARASIAEADDEILAVLEEVVMYTFQQTVYYLTKTLYATLPLILDSNPFAPDSDDMDHQSAGVRQVLSVYQSAFNLLRDFHLHRSVLSQLFCYLFFFTSTSLFNTLIGKGPSQRDFRWSKGVQMRGNLDVLEQWASDVKLYEEASTYLVKVNAVADLLATPKVQLLQADWTSLRRDYPSLNASQLHHILQNYQLGPGKSRPAAWSPKAPELRNSGEILESFNNHPPLILPGEGFVVNLSHEVEDKTFYDILQDIHSSFGIVEDDVDSGLSLSQSHDLTLFNGGQVPNMYFKEEHLVPNLPITKDNKERQRISNKKHTSSANEKLQHREEPPVIPAPKPPKRRQSLKKKEAMGTPVPVRPARKKRDARRRSQLELEKRHSGYCSEASLSPRSEPDLRRVGAVTPPTTVHATEGVIDTNAKFVGALPNSSDVRDTNRRLVYDSMGIEGRSRDIDGDTGTVRVTTNEIPDLESRRAKYSDYIYDESHVSNVRSTTSMQTDQGGTIRSTANVLRSESLSRKQKFDVRSHLAKQASRACLSPRASGESEFNSRLNQSEADTSKDEENKHTENKMSVSSAWSSDIQFTKPKTVSRRDYNQEVKETEMSQNAEKTVEQHDEAKIISHDCPWKSQPRSKNCQGTDEDEILITDPPTEKLYLAASKPSVSITTQPDDTARRQQHQPQHSVFDEGCQENGFFDYNETLEKEEPVYMNFDHDNDEAPRRPEKCSLDKRWISGIIYPNEPNGIPPQPNKPAPVLYKSSPDEFELGENAFNNENSTYYCANNQSVPYSSQGPVPDKQSHVTNSEGGGPKRPSKTSFSHRNHADIVKQIKSYNQQGEIFGSSSPELILLDLAKGEEGLGVGLIDGLYTELGRSGIYVRTLVPGGAAARNGTLAVGDRILWVNGFSLLGSTYQGAMASIKNAGNQLKLMVAKATAEDAKKIAASPCVF